MRTIKMTPIVERALRKQLKLFKEKFGRDPEGNDPVFFDPEFDYPVPIDCKKYEKEFIEVGKRMGIKEENMRAWLYEDKLLKKT